MLRYKRNVLPDEESEREQPKPVRFLQLCGILVVLAFALLVYQLYQVQIVQGEYYRLAADTNRFRLLTTSAPRGVIYDRNGKQLVNNEPSFKISLMPVDLPAERQDQVLKQIAALIDAPLETALESDTSDAVGSLASDVSRTFVSPTRKPGLVELVNEGRRADPYAPVLLKADVPRAVAFVLQERAAEFPGLRVDIDPVRDYPSSTLLAHLLGYVGHMPREIYDNYKTRGYESTDQVGLTGLEYQYEDQLHGQPGQRHVEVDANGNVLRVQEETAPRPGNNLYLTIDLDLQRKTEAALKSGMDKISAKQGVAIVLDPNNGEILAMVSLPTYDNNLFAHGITLTAYQSLSQDAQRPLVDHAISGQYPPGSVFKLVAASGALQEGIIDTKMTLFDPGVIYVPNKYFPNDQRLAQPFYNWYRPGFGSLTLAESIAQSCDTCFYKLVGGFTDFPTPLGQALESDYARMFGYGAPTGIDLPGEAPGLIPDPQWKRKTLNEQWVTGDTYNMAIGQGFVLSTPLQVVQMTAAVANGGTLYRPHLVRAIVNADATITNTVTSQVIRHLTVDDKNLQVVRDGMRGAVTYGTAWKVNLAQVTVAGKTGTAEYFGPRVNGNLPTHAWFTAFAPFDKPRIAVVAFVAGGGQGSEVAGPIASEIIKAFFNIPPDAPLAKTEKPPPPPETSRSQGTGAVAPASNPAARKFSGRVRAVQEASDHERPVFNGAVLDVSGHGLAGLSVSLDAGDGNAVATITTSADGSFSFADVDFHKSARWFVRLSTPVETAVIAVDIQPYKRYILEFNSTGQ